MISMKSTTITPVKMETCLKQNFFLSNVIMSQQVCLYKEWKSATTKTCLEQNYFQFLMIPSKQVLLYVSTHGNDKHGYAKRGYATTNIQA